MEQLPHLKFDAIVIGSGIGGLTAAAILSRFANKRVLVLERHYEIGGLTHEFRRGPFSFDVGLHYVGRSVTESHGKKIFQYITDGHIRWNKMDDVHEKFIFPNFSVDAPASKAAYQTQLEARFPQEKKAIRTYFKDVARAQRWYMKNFMTTITARPVRTILSQLNRSTRELALSTLQSYLDTHFQDEKLKRVLSSRWGDYGLPPSRAAFCIHAVVEAHYFDGGYFPDGGAEQIALHVERVIEEAGGCIATCCDATQIELKNNKAIGVRFQRLPANGHESVVYAPLIISTIGAWPTYLRLLPKSLNLPIQKRLTQFPLEYSAVSLYLGLKNSVSSIGITGANQWLHGDKTIDNGIDTNAITPNTPANAVFLSFPSTKSNKGLMHAAEAIAFMPQHLFDQWKTQPWKQRDAEYHAFKERIAENMLALIEKHNPGFRDLIAFQEIATPLTIEHFTQKPSGALYGIPSVPERFVANEFQPKTPIENLFLGGGDAAALGIMGAMMGGLGAASVALDAEGGKWSFFKIVGRAGRALRKRKPFTSSNLAIKTQPSKMDATIKHKEALSSSVYRVRFKLPVDFAMFPGQHVKVMVSPDEWRAYSLEEIHGNEATLLVDTKHDGPGSRFMKTIKASDTMTLRLPLTDFSMPTKANDSTTGVAMFATSVGISSILSVLQELDNRSYPAPIHLFFGAPNETQLFIEPLLAKYADKLALHVTYCVDSQGANRTYFHGNVVDAFRQSNLNAAQLDHYICGNPFMVQAVIQHLYRNGAVRVHW